MKLRSRKGFTLAELLIVMAIIVVLASVAIPSFTRQLETSRETADLETLRNAYTEAYTRALADISDDGLLNTEVTTGDELITPTKTAGATQWKSSTYTIAGLKFVQATAGFDYVSGTVGSVDVTTLTTIASTHTKATFTFTIDNDGKLAPGAITFAS